MDVVLNWLAQGVILALAVAGALQVIPRSRTQARYGLLWAAYLSVLVLPAVAPIVELARDVAQVDVGSAVADPLVTVPAVWWASATVAAGLWIAWFGMHVVALGRDVAAAHDAKHRGDPFPRELLARLPHWSRVSLTGRSASVVVSDRVRAAGVLGCGTPVIAIAPRLVEKLSAADLDRVLVHEWAHVQRRDDLGHVVQRLVRAMVGWHPAAWWLARQLEFEREMACDEIAVRVTGSAKRYAECLVTIAALKRQPARPVLIVAAVSRSRLHQRVERILAVRCAALVRPWRALTTGGALGLVACALALGHVHVVTSSLAPAVGMTAEPVSAQVVGPSQSTPASLAATTSVWSSVRAKNRPSRTRAQPGARGTGPLHDAGKTYRSEESPMMPVASVPLPSMGEPLSATLFEPVTSRSSEPAEHAMVAAPSPAVKDSVRDVSAGWTRAADAGVTIGRASQAAGVATAGFFRRFGKKVADSF